ncbi:MAG TPA: ferredoxin [Pseudonocardiaceae bacterium]|nr:ferredoxin [Pseudonocardiaceae bacterium]
MKIEADQEVCCGSGLCALTAPAVFDQRDDDGIVVALTTEPGEADYDAVRAAAAACPTSAIHLME